MHQQTLPLPTLNETLVAYANIHLEPAQHVWTVRQGDDIIACCPLTAVLISLSLVDIGDDDRQIAFVAARTFGERPVRAFIAALHNMWQPLWTKADPQHENAYNRGTTIRASLFG